MCHCPALGSVLRVVWDPEAPGAFRDCLGSCCPELSWRAGAGSAVHTPTAPRAGWTLQRLYTGSVLVGGRGNALVREPPEQLPKSAPRSCPQSRCVRVTYVGLKSES